jgi:hypothetical protein
MKRWFDPDRRGCRHVLLYRYGMSLPIRADHSFFVNHQYNILDLSRGIDSACDPLSSAYTSTHYSLRCSETPARLLTSS